MVRWYYPHPDATGYSGWGSRGSMKIKSLFYVLQRARGAGIAVSDGRRG